MTPATVRTMSLATVTYSAMQDMFILRHNVKVPGAARFYRAASSDQRQRGRLPGWASRRTPCMSAHVNEVDDVGAAGATDNKGIIGEGRNDVVQSADRDSVTGDEF